MIDFDLIKLRSSAPLSELTVGEFTYLMKQILNDHQPKLECIGKWASQSEEVRRLGEICENKNNEY